MKARDPIKLTCLRCGEDFYVEPWRVNRKNTTAKYCSLTCSQISKATVAGAIMQSRRGSGTKHPYVKYKGRHMHRVVAENKLGRPLNKGEIVHHRDGNGHNNDPENLEVTTQSKHIEIHRAHMLRRRLEVAGY